MHTGTLTKHGNRHRHYKTPKPPTGRVYRRVATGNISDPSQGQKYCLVCQQPFVEYGAWCRGCRPEAVVKMHYNCALPGTAPEAPESDLGGLWYGHDWYDRHAEREALRAQRYHLPADWDGDWDNAVQAYEGDGT